MSRRDQANPLSTIIWSVTSLGLGFLVWSFISGSNSLPYHSYLVQSGSMEPSIRVGDVIVVQTQDTYSVNDVITFTDSTTRRVTHRLAQIQITPTGKIFTTKGDANRAGDRETINANQVIGSVILVIPKIGFFVNFLKSVPGFLLFIVLPAILIILSELKNIARQKEQGS